MTTRAGATREEVGLGQQPTHACAPVQRAKRHAGGVQTAISGGCMAAQGCSACQPRCRHIACHCRPLLVLHTHPPRPVPRGPPDAAPWHSRASAPSSSAACWPSAPRSRPRPLLPPSWTACCRLRALPATTGTAGPPWWTSRCWTYAKVRLGGGEDIHAGVGGQPRGKPLTDGYCACAKALQFASFTPSPGRQTSPHGGVHTSHIHRPAQTHNPLPSDPGRHPLAELIAEGPGGFVPNDTLMPAAGPRLHVVTGPNASGKSCYTKQACGAAPRAVGLSHWHGATSAL